MTDELQVRITDHAADRYVERVKPHLTRDTARYEMGRLLEVAGEPVPYCDFVEDVEEFDCFVELAPGIALALRYGDGQLMAVTTVIRTGENKSSKRSRRHQKKIKKRRSQAAKAKERMHRSNGRAKRPEDKETSWRDSAAN